MKSQLLTLTVEECDKLLWYLRQRIDDDAPKRVHHRNYTMALIMLDTGCRVGELVQLRQDQLFFCGSATNTLMIEKSQAKNKHERWIPITDRLRNAIGQMNVQWWIKDTVLGERSAFYQTSSQYPLSTRQVRRIISSAGLASINREVHPHLLRHTFGSRLMRKASLRVVQELLGHKSISSTQIYTHPNNEDRQKAIDSLNEKE